MNQYSIELKFVSAIVGWRFAVVENGKMVHHYATYTEALHVKESLERGTHTGGFAPSRAIREGFNEEHFKAVLRAREWMDERAA